MQSTLRQLSQAISPLSESTKRTFPARFKDGLLIFFMCAVAMAIYGLVLDQITAHLFPDSLSRELIPLPSPSDSALLALFSGALTTWWIGFPLGGGLTVACCLRPIQTSPQALLAPIARLAGLMGCCAALSGAGGYIALRTGWLVLPDDVGQFVPMESRASFAAVSFSQLASFGCGFLGGLHLILRAAQGAFSDGE